MGISWLDTDEEERETTSETWTNEEGTIRRKISLILNQNNDNSHGDSVLDLECGGSELGCRLWTASVVLCQYLQSKPDLVRDLDVLEIGAGLGACGFVAWALGARSTTIADCAPDTMKRLSKTLVSLEASKRRQRENSCAKSGEEKEHDSSVCSDGKAPVWNSSVPGLNVSLCRHLWEEDLEFMLAQEEGREMNTVRHWSKYRNESILAPSLGFGQKFDIVLGSDLLYFSCQEAPLLAALKLRLKPGGGGKAIILQTMRTNNVDVFRRFIDSARQLFRVDIVDDVRPEDFLGGTVQAVRPNETNHTTGYKLVTITTHP